MPGTALKYGSAYRRAKIYINISFISFFHARPDFYSLCDYVTEARHQLQDNAHNPSTQSNNMKKLSALIIIGFLPFNSALAVDTEQLTQTSRAAAKALGGELKSTLQASMKASGPVDSIVVCNVDAPNIAKKVSEDKGLRVARTSLKFRNQANKPDAWEKSVLEQFEQRKANGEPIKTLEFSEVSEIDGRKVFRYMKAIPTGDVCLKCHGTNIAEPVAARINSLYPNDKATGFSKGDIRGAFTVTQTIN